MTDEIRLALFGEAGAGKSAFISSFYGNLSSSEFSSENKYCVRCTDPKRRNQLESDFNKMRDHKLFPTGTTKVNNYLFSLKTDGYEKSEASIRWSDYPGKWWENNIIDESEKKAKKIEFKNLLYSHVGILLIDGQKYASGSTEYIKELFARYNSSFKEIINESRSVLGIKGPVLPETWIISVTKSDLFDEKLTAQWVRGIIVRDALKELHDLQDTLGAHFGDNIILSSAVKASGDRVLSANEYLGLQLFAPIGFKSYFLKATQPGLYDYVLHGIDNFLHFLSQNAEFIPSNVVNRKLNMITMLVKAANKLGLTKMANDAVKAILDNKEADRDYFDVTLSRIMAHTSDESLTRLHFSAK